MTTNTCHINIQLSIQYIKSLKSISYFKNVVSNILNSSTKNSKINKTKTKNVQYVQSLQYVL